MNDREIMESAVDCESANAPELCEIENEYAIDNGVSESENLVEQHTMQKEKKLGLQKPIIVAFCILLAAIIGFGSMMRYNHIMKPTIIGTWVFVSESEDSEEQSNDVYVTFKEKGVASISTGTFESKGTWSQRTENDVTYMSVNIPNSPLYSDIYGEYTVKLSGNAFTKVDLNIKNLYTEFNFEKATKKEVFPDKFEKANIDGEVVGNWVYTTETGDVYTYKFNDDGTFMINEKVTVDGISGDYTFKGVYTVAEEGITLRYTDAQDRELTFPFEKIDADTISFNTMDFEKNE